MSKSVRVTDHAVLRYLQRVRGMDVEAIRKHIAAVCAPGLAGANAVRAEGVKFVIANGMHEPAVTSVVPDGTIPDKTAQDRLMRRA